MSECVSVTGVDPGPKLRSALRMMTTVERELFYAHLHGGTSAEWLADVLTRFGFPVSASTIRTYRRALRREGV